MNSICNSVYILIRTLSCHDKNILVRPAEVITAVKQSVIVEIIRIILKLIFSSSVT